MPATQNAIEQCFCFEELDQSEVSELSRISQYKHLEANEALFHQGDEAGFFYILIDGRIQAYKLSQEGQEMTMHLFGPGDIFAELPVFGHHKTYPVSTRALESSNLLAVEGAPFIELASKKPAILLKVLTRLCQRLREFGARIEDLTFLSVDARLAKYLLSVVAEGQTEIHLRTSKKTLASMLGTIPETLSRAFKRMTKEGMITLNDDTVAITDLDGLTRLAQID